jgi:hypothetical protein
MDIIDLIEDGEVIYPTKMIPRLFARNPISGIR